MNNRTLLGTLLVLVAVGLLFAASPAAAQPQTTDSTINYTIEPTNGEVLSGGVQTYSINVVGPNEGIATYSEVIVNVTDPSVANITSVTETRTSGAGESKILTGGNSLLLKRALGGNPYNASAEITIATFEVTATGSAGQSTALEYDLTNGRLITRNQSNVIYSPVQPPGSGPNEGGDKANLAPRAVSNASFSVVEPQNFTVSNLQPASATVIGGSTLDISADVENTGGVQGTQTVTLSVGNVTQTKDVTLGAGANTTVTFPVDTVALGAGTFSPTVASANDSATGSLTVEAPPRFVVSNAVASPATVTNGTTVDISADVENTGDVQGSQTVTLSVGGLTRTQSETLAGGANTTVTFSVNTSLLGSGTYDPTIASANDSAAANLTVRSRQNFQVSIVTIDSKSTSGQPLDVEISVTNTGGTAGTQTIVADAGPLGTDSTRTFLAGGRNATLTTTLSINTGAGDAGSYTVTVSSENDSASRNVSVLKPATFDVGIQSTNSPVDEGDTLSVNATVQNTGEVQGTQTVTLSVGELGSDSQQVTLLSGNSTTVALSVATGTGEAGTYTATVTSTNDSASKNVKVLAPSNFQVSNLQPATATVTEGSTASVSADIDNTGGQSGTQALTLTVGGVTQTQTRTLNASENTTVTFSVDTGVLGPGTYSPTIASANDSATGSLTVQAPANFGVSVQSTNSPVVEGRTLDVTATLQNTGDVSGTQTVDLNVGTLGSDSQSVTLASGASQNVTLSVGTASGEVGTFTATVSSANDSISQSVTVRDQATVELRATDGSVRLGKNTTVQVVASGVTTDVGSYDIDISLNDSAASVLAVDVLGTVTSDNTVLTGSSVSLNASVTGTGSGEVVLANLTVQFDTNASASRGIYQRGDGTASVGVTGESLVDSTGSVYVTQRTNTTVSAVGPPAIDGRFPADPDNDGLYEDLTGFSIVTVGDVQTLFDRGISNPRPSLTKYTPFYNFATGFGAPQLSVGDAQTLFEEV